MFATALWRDGLDDAQMEVAEHSGGPLLVAAGAGTGKTRALTARVAHLIEQGADPERVLLLTFTRRAAQDMLSRAMHLARAKVDGARRPRGGTFHSVAHHCVSTHAEALGYPKGFSVLGPGEASDLMELVRAESSLANAQSRAPRAATLAEMYSRCVNTGSRVSTTVASSYPWCQPHVDVIADLFRGYTVQKRRQALMDFDDLLLHWRALLTDATVGAQLASRFDHVLVDEYQDLNELQVEIVRCLAGEGRGLTVVGDEAQAIYGFRGAAAGRLREMVLGLAGAQVVRLERNFRSRQAILDLANALRPAATGPLVQLVGSRGSGARPVLMRCYDAPSEARAVVSGVLERYESGVALRDQAVLVRASHHSDLIELELSARKVPYRKYGGLRFLEAAHVKDFVAAGRVLINPNDELAWFRLLRLHEKVGPASARTMVSAVLPCDDALEKWGEMVAVAPAPARAQLSHTLEALFSARASKGSRAQAEAVLQAVRPLLVQRYADAAPRLADLEALAAAADGKGFANWLADLALDPPESTGDLAGPPLLDEDYLVISTVHSAKGLEWGVVHVPHLIEGAFPSDMALGSDGGLDEERRLLYVAATRARDELYLYAPLRMPFHRRGSDDRHGYAQLSRFLSPEVLRLVEPIEEPAATSPMDRGSDIATSVEVDLSALWS